MLRDMDNSVVGHLFAINNWKWYVCNQQPKVMGLFTWTYQSAYQLKFIIFFSHNKLVSASLSAGLSVYIHDVTQLARKEKNTVSCTCTYRRSTEQQCAVGTFHSYRNDPQRRLFFTGSILSRPINDHRTSHSYKSICRSYWRYQLLLQKVIFVEATLNPAALTNRHWILKIKY